MSVLAPVRQTAADQQLGGEVVRHLEAQLVSARALLAVVLEQGGAIRAHDSQTVVRLAGIMRGEMGRRELLEQQRGALLERAAAALGTRPEEVTLERLTSLMDPAEAQRASALSAELKGLLVELQREHSANRAVMQVELGFLDHLMGLLALDGVSGYDTRGGSTAITSARPHGGMHVLDLRA